MALVSSPVLPSDVGRASQYNDLRTDLITHSHDGADTPSLILANNQYLQGRDNTSVPRSLIGVDTANVVQLGGGLPVRATSALQVANGLTVNLGGVVVQNGGMNVTGPSVLNTGLTVTGTINGQTISAAASLTGSLTVANSLVVSNGGLNVTGPSVLNSALTVTGLLSANGSIALPTNNALVTFAAQTTYGTIRSGQSGLAVQDYTGGFNNLVLTNVGDAIVRGTLSVGGRVSVTAAGPGLAGSVYRDTAGGLVVWGVTGSQSDFTLLNNAGAGVFSVPAGTQDIFVGGSVIVSNAIRLIQMSSQLLGVRDAANTGYVDLVARTIAGSTSLQAGTGVMATTGTVRLPNGASIYVRGPGAFDIPLLVSSGSGVVVGGASNTSVVVQAAGEDMTMTANGTIFGGALGGYKGQGSITAKAVYDDTTLLTDRVFEPDYRLVPLAEMAAFARRERHLPTIPGRAVWDAEGPFSLGMLGTHLWETVEAQALYIAELHERLAALEAVP